LIGDERLLRALGDTAREAGEAILKIVRAGFDVTTKGDDSPVTIADHAAEAVILDALARLAPDVPVIAEEEVAAGRVPSHGDSFFLVDPLDGTRSFIEGKDDYTVNIGLIDRGVPTMGIIFAPATGRLHLGLAGHGALLDEGQGAKTIAVRSMPDRMTAVASRSHFNKAAAQYLDQAFPGREIDRVSIGSSLKFGLVAEGVADLYPRLSPTMEWDTAAGHAILLAAGGRCDGPDGRPLQYGKARFFNPGFCATSGWEAPAISSFMD